MAFTNEEAYHLSLISYFTMVKKCETISDFIIDILLDDALRIRYENDVLFQSNYELLKMIPISHYTDFYITDYYDDNEKSGVVLYKIERAKDMMIAIRGSEMLDDVDHMTGWQDWSDNFAMFLNGPTTQQLITFRYISSIQTNKAVSICGHSKGGNLAIFQMIACTKQQLHQIEHVYTFNAPGITKSLYDSYEERILSEEFQNKITLYENEHDCISEFFLHVKQPCLVKSTEPMNNFMQAYHNHNLFAYAWEHHDVIPASKKSVLPIMTNHFINGFFARLPQSKLYSINTKVEDYFKSGLPLSELYRVLIYHISAYTSLFDDIDFEEVKTITFSDLLQRRKSKKIIARLKEDIPAYLNEQDIQQITASVIENYNMIKQGTSDKFQKIITENNQKIKDKIKSIQNRK